MNEVYFEGQSHGRLLFILTVVAFFVLMCGSGSLSLTHPDEVFYIQTAKEMLAHHSWLTPIIFDQPQFEKPFLSYFLFALGIKFFGLGSFVARFWPALFGMIAIGVTYWISWMLFHQKRISFFAGLILTTSFISIALSRAVLTDMIFSVLVVISIGFFLCANRYKHWSTWGVLAGFIFSALAVLTKGLLGYTFPLTIVTLYSIFKQDRSFWRSKATWGGIILFLLIALPWHLWMYKSYGQPFVDEYWWNAHVHRIFVAEHSKSNTWYFYPLTMFLGVMPWSLFLIPALGLCFKHVSRKLESFDSLSFVILWILGVFVYVQIAQSKLASYIYPVFPAIAILIAYYLHHALSGRNQCQRSFKMIGYVMPFLLSGAVAAGIFFGRKYSHFIVVPTPFYFLAVSLLVVAVMIFIFNRSLQYGKMMLCFPCITFVLLLALFQGIVYAEPWVSCKKVSEVLQTLDRSQNTLLTSKFYVRGVRYYTNRKVAVIDINGRGFFSPHPIPFLNQEKAVLDFLDNQPFTYAVVKKGDVDELKKIVKNSPWRIEELYGDGGKFILKIQKKDF